MQCISQTILKEKKEVGNLILPKIYNNYCTFRNLVKKAHFKGSQFKQLQLIQMEMSNCSRESFQTIQSYCLTPTLDKATCVGNNLATVIVHSQWKKIFHLSNNFSQFCISNFVDREKPTHIKICVNLDFVRTNLTMLFDCDSLIVNLKNDTETLSPSIQNKVNKIVKKHVPLT